MADTADTTDPIAESLPYDSEESDERQDAWHAVVHLVVPYRDSNNNLVSNDAAAQDYISETLRGLFLDWGYVRDEAGEMRSPRRIEVCRPYVEGTFPIED